MTRNELQNKVKTLRSYNDAHEFQQTEHNRLQAASAALALLDAENAIDDCLQHLCSNYEAVVNNTELYDAIVNIRKKVLSFAISLHVEAGYLSNFTDC